MPTIIQKADHIFRARAVTLCPVDLDGTKAEGQAVLILRGITDIPIQQIIEAGEKVVDKADGVGVIAVHEEDDTLIGVDLDVSAIKIDFYALSTIVGGQLLTDDMGVITGWIPPTITEQRDNPKRFEVDIYGEISGGFIRHRFFYCRGQFKSMRYGLGLGQLAISIQARPTPTSGQLQALEYVTQLPI